MPVLILVGRQSQLAEDVADVLIDGRFGDEELRRDGGIGMSLRDKGKHFPVARGQATGRILAAQQLPDHLRVDDRRARCHLAHRLDELRDVGDAVLEQDGQPGMTSAIAVGARAEHHDLIDAQLVVTSPGDRTAQLQQVEGVALASPSTTLPGQLVAWQGTKGSPNALRQKWTGQVTAINPHAYAATHRWSRNRAALSELKAGFIYVSAADEDQGRLHDLRLILDGRSVELTRAGVIPVLLAPSETFLVSRATVPDKALRDAPSETLIQLAPGVPRQRPCSPASRRRGWVR